MKNDMRTLLSIIAAAMCFVSCGTKHDVQTVNYTIAHGYFVRNDAPSHAPNYYDSKEAFGNVFGCAAVMGKDGQPTMIDFSRQSVIAVIGRETNRPTAYTPISLTSHADTLRLDYSVREEAATSYTMLPLLLLVIDKPTFSPCVQLERQ